MSKQFRNGDRVTVDSEPGTIEKVFKNDKVRVSFDNEEVTTANFNIDAVTPLTRGRTKIVDSMTEKELADEIDELLSDLQQSEDQAEKSRIRRKLRLRGHTGGLQTQSA